MEQAQRLIATSETLPAPKCGAVQSATEAPFRDQLSRIETTLDRIAGILEQDVAAGGLQ